LGQPESDTADEGISSSSGVNSVDSQRLNPRGAPSLPYNSTRRAQCDDDRTRGSSEVSSRRLCCPRVWIAAALGGWAAARLRPSEALARVE